MKQRAAEASSEKSSAPNGVPALPQRRRVPRLIVRTVFFDEAILEATGDPLGAVRGAGRNAFAAMQARCWHA